MAILAGAVVLSLPEAAATGPRLSWGSVLIVLACVSWGIDNNVTRKLSAADPLQIAMIKGLAGGTVNLALALARGAPLPGLITLVVAAGVGFFGYGVSLVLFVLGLRHLGAAYRRLLLDRSLYRCSPCASAVWRDADPRSHGRGAADGYWRLFAPRRGARPRASA